MGEILKEVIKAAKESPRMYFAPLTGAANAVYREATRGTIKAKTKKEGPQTKKSA